MKQKESVTVPGLLEDLEGEFIASVEGWSTAVEISRAVHFSEVQSGKFCAQAGGVIALLLHHREACATDPVLAQKVVSCSTKSLLKVLVNEIAPLWARAEYEKRREETLEMPEVSH